MIDHNADVNDLIVDQRGDNPIRRFVSALHLAAAHGHVDCVKLLLERNANKEQQDSELWTPLHYASCFGRLKVVKWLVNKRANIDAETRDGQTPLLLAFSNEDSRVYDYLKKQIIKSHS